MPEAIRDIVGRPEIKKSLKTSDRREAIRLCRIESIRADAIFDKARREIDDRPLISITASQAEYLAAEWFHSLENKSTQSEPRETDLPRDEYEEQLKQDIFTFSDPESVQALQSAQHALKEIAQKSGFIVNFNNPAVRRLETLIRRGLREDARRQLQRLHSEHTREGADEFFEGIEGERSFDRRPPITLNQLIEAFKVDRPETRSPKTGMKREAQLALITEFIGGDTPVRDIRREHAKAFRTMLRKLPAHARKKFPGITFREIAEFAAESGLDAMSVTNANINLAALSGLMDYAVNEGHIPQSPATGLQIAQTAALKNDAATAFTRDQLTKIFDAPLYRGCVNDQAGYGKAGSNRPRRARFWVPLVALFTGMRLEEICQLEASDIVERDGVPVILVTSEGSRRVKTEAGERYIPVHPELVRLGFLDRAANVRQNGGGRLFPELTMAKSGYYSDNFSKWFANFLRSTKTKLPQTRFHSFRHAFRDALREADTSRERVRALGGWSSGKTEDGYGRGHRPKTLADEIAKIRYEGLSLAHLYPVSVPDAALS